jgi:hypothetical protein
MGVAERLSERFTVMEQRREPFSKSATPVIRAAVKAGVERWTIRDAVDHAMPNGGYLVAGLAGRALEIAGNSAPNPSKSKELNRTRRGIENYESAALTS